MAGSLGELRLAIDHSKYMLDLVTSSDQAMSSIKNWRLFK